MSEDPLQAGRAALRRGDGAGARAAFLELPESGRVLEGLGSASYLLTDYERATHELERAYAAYRSVGDRAGAVRVCRVIGSLYGGVAGQWAIANGWISRAQSMLDERPDPVEQGWVTLTRGMFESDRDKRNKYLRKAADLGATVGDNDLRFAALAYLGASLVHADRVAEAMTLLDEALAAVTGGDVEAFIVVEEIFCQLFTACEHAHDVHRAEQWIAVGERVAARRGLPVVSAYCRTHYGGILVAAGRWSEADAALTEAVRLWTISRRSLKADALTRLAALRVRQGRFDEAAELLDGISTGEAVRTRAELYLARGDTHLALDLLKHAVQEALGDTEAVPLLGLLVEAQVACTEDAGETLTRLERCAAAHPSPYARAVVARSRGLSARVVGELRDAAELFAAVQLPLESAIARLDLARVIAKQNPPVAASEARQALRIFDQLMATRHADAAAALLRKLGDRVGPPRSSGALLTHREQEVLDLVGAGLSNPEIAERLYISRKTVEHHVGNVLAKLGLRNRAEAAAYAVKQEPAQG